MLCKNCVWFGIEEKKFVRNVFTPLIDGKYSVEYTEDMEVCNYENPSVPLRNRKNSCSKFKDTI